MALAKVMALKLLEASTTMDAVACARTMCKTMIKRLLKMGQYLGKTPEQWVDILADAKDAELQVRRIRAVIRRRELKYLTSLLRNAIDEKHVATIMSETTYTVEDIKSMYMGRFPGPPPQGHPTPWLFTQPSPLRLKKRLLVPPGRIKMLHRFAKQPRYYHH